MDSSQSIGNDLSPKTKKIMDMVKTMMQASLDERFDEARREKEERRLRKEHDKRILEEASRNREHHGRKEKTLRENHERMERKEHERRRETYRGNGSERENQRTYSSLNDKFDRLEKENHERRRRKEYELRYDHERVDKREKQERYHQSHQRSDRDYYDLKREYRERKERKLIEQNERIYTELVRKKKELREKELREKELEEKELREKEIQACLRRVRELELLEKQMKEKDDLLLASNNSSFDIFYSFFEDVVGVMPKEEFKEQIDHLLCEDVERNELNVLVKDACDHLYKLPFDLIPNKEMCTKEPLNNYDMEKEIPLEFELPFEKISLSPTTTFTSNKDEIALESYGFKPWTTIEIENLQFLVVPINHCYHDVDIFFRLLEEPKKEGTPQSSTPSEEIWMKEQISTKIKKGEETLKSFCYTINKYFNSFFPSLNGVVDMNRLYTLLLNIKFDRVCLIFDPGGNFL